MNMYGMYEHVWHSCSCVAHMYPGYIPDHPGCHICIYSSRGVGLLPNCNNQLLPGVWSSNIGHWYFKVGGQIFFWTRHGTRGGGSYDILLKLPGSLSNSCHPGMAPGGLLSSAMMAAYLPSAVMAAYLPSTVMAAYLPSAVMAAYLPSAVMAAL